MSQTVVHFIDSSTYGGCEEVITHLLSEQVHSRFRPVLFHYDEPGIARLIENAGRLGVECRAVPPLERRNLRLNLGCFMRELRRVRPAVFHAHLNWPLSCRHALLGARLAGVRGVVATSHLFFTIADERFGWLKQQVQATAIGRYIAVSSEVKERLCLELGVREAKVRVVHNGIRLAPFESSADPMLRATLQNGSEVPIVFTPARLHRQKGHVYLLEAAVQVPHAVFVLAGDGPERNALEELARRLGVSDRVRFLGFRKDIPQLLASCDVFVLPSLYEGMPISVLEAMAAGKAIVATAIGGTDESVVHGRTGLLVPPENPSELAAAIRRVLGDRGFATQMADAARARAKELFSSEAMTRNVNRVYEELLAGVNGESSKTTAAGE